METVLGIGIEQSAINERVFFKSVENVFLILLIFVSDLVLVFK